MKHLIVELEETVWLWHRLKLPHDKILDEAKIMIEGCKELLEVWK